jgi:hypothetical protein
LPSAQRIGFEDLRVHARILRRALAQVGGDGARTLQPAGLDLDLTCAEERRRLGERRGLLGGLERADGVVPPEARLGEENALSRRGVGALLGDVRCEALHEESGRVGVAAFREREIGEAVVRERGIA